MGVDPRGRRLLRRPATLLRVPAGAGRGWMAWPGCTAGPSWWEAGSDMADGGGRRGAAGSSVGERMRIINGLSPVRE